MPSADPPVLDAPKAAPGNPFFRNRPAMVGLAFLTLMFIACVALLPITLGDPDGQDGPRSPRFQDGTAREGLVSPIWWPADDVEALKLNAALDEDVLLAIAERTQSDPATLTQQLEGPAADAMRAQWPKTERPAHFFLGTDLLGRSLLFRVLTGGGISLAVGIAAAALSVFIGTMYGAIAGYIGGKLDSVMMRIVDILYGLPYILLVVLLAVASDALVEEYVTRGKARQAFVMQQAEAKLIAESPGVIVNTAAVERFLADNLEQAQAFRADAEDKYPERNLNAIGGQTTLDVVALIVAIGGVSWLTMARVIRGQVLSLKSQPFVEAARAAGAGGSRVFARHLLPNLVGPIVVYSTLTVPQAILQESFLSFLGIGVKPPLPSWGNLAADGLSELNTFRSHWWLLLFPSLLLGLTLLALNFVGEGLREAFDPRRGKR